MDAKQARKFIEEKESFTTEVNLTKDQVEIILGLAEKSDISFEDMVMILLHHQLKGMDEVIRDRKIAQQARRN